MIYQKALKELNTVFPKLNIKPPSKKSTCPQFSNTDFTLLKNPQTCAKPLSKLSNLVSTWIKVVQHNQKARQQQQAKPLSFKQIENMQYMLAECEQIGSKSQFVYFIRQKAEQFYGSVSNAVSQKDYKETYVCKEAEFYNTITRVQEEEYLRLLEELGEQLGIMQQLVASAGQNSHYLQEFHAMLQGHELFRKKDNSLNRVINYNLVRAAQLSKSIQKMKKMYYHYEQSLTYSLARCYYLLYLCRADIERNRDNEHYLNEIKKFICERPEQVFTKLYHRKIAKSLVLLDRVTDELRHRPYSNKPITKDERIRIAEKIANIQQKIKVNENKPLSEQLFLQIFGEIQLLIVQISAHLNYQPQDEQLRQNTRKLYECEAEVVKAFTNEGTRVGSKSNRKILSVENSRLSGRSGITDKKSKNKDLDKSIRNTLKSGYNEGYNNPEVDRGQDIFVYAPLASIPPEKVKQRIQHLSKNNADYEAECKKYLAKIDPSFGECLEDGLNFNPEELNILIQSGSMSQSTNQEKQILMMLNRSLIKPEITEENMMKIFKPKLRVFVLKTLSQKLLELSYKNAKVFDNPQFGALPQNVRKFVETRNLFLKTVNKQIQKIIDIAALLSRLKIKEKFDVCDYHTYETFLKVLLAEKEVRAYQLSFRDEKNIPKSAGFFVNNKVYGPFLESITELLPPPYNQPRQIVDVLDHLQFFTDFVKETEDLIAKYLSDMQAEKDKNSLNDLCKQLSRVLKKWGQSAQEKLKLRRQGLQYDKAELQILRINQIMKACNNQNVPQIRDPTAKKIIKILNNKP